MIQEFSFGNFRSFKDIQTLNMAGAKIKSKNKELDVKNIITIDDKLSLLKSKAIYGANASGKSNVVRALLLFIKTVHSSVIQDDILDVVSDSFKLSSESENSPSFFQMVFHREDTKFRYGFEADSKKIHSEWLFATSHKREQVYFLRENETIIEIDKTNFNEGHKYFELLNENQTKGNKVSSTSLFLTVLASFQFPISKIVKNYIENINVVNGLESGNRLFQFAKKEMQKEEKKNFTTKLLKYADVGIEHILTYEVSEDLTNKVIEKSLKSREEIPDTLLVSVKNKVGENSKKLVVFPFHESESEGTKKIFELSPVLHHVLKNGIPLFIDEFDARFHPLLTKKIVELFNSATNKNAQLIFVTHDTNLLSADLLRRDQIDFVEKDKYGASYLYTLVQFKGVRNTASFEKDYIQGKYGAIPFLGDFEALFNQETEKNAEEN